MCRCVVESYTIVLHCSVKDLGKKCKIYGLTVALFQP